MRNRRQVIRYESKDIDQVGKYKSKNVNRLLIVGHQLSGYERVERLLNSGGMVKAADLRKEQLRATEISKVIKKSNNVSEQSYDQLEVAPVWNNLALDLMMSNMDNKLWGWSDSDAVSILNYWREVDPNLAFILVYNSPQSFIKRLLNGVADISNKLLQDKISDYIKYNEALLQFFYQNIEESILVSSEQVSCNAKEYIEQLESQLSLVNILSTDAVVNVDDKEKKSSGYDEVSDYLIEQLIKKNTQLTDMFDELQSVAVLPQDYVGYDNNDNQECIVNALIKRNSDIKVVKNLEVKCQQSEKQLQVLNVENSSIKEQKNKIDMKLKQAGDENEILMESLFQGQEELEKLYKDKNVVKSQLQNLEKQKNDIEKRLNNVVDQTKLLTEQNKKIDEARKNLEIEYKQKNSDLEQKNSDLEQKNSDLEQKNSDLEQKNSDLEQKNSDLEQKNSDLEQKIKQQSDVLDSRNKLEENVRKLAEENDSLLCQILSMQEELEKAYLTGKLTKNKPVESTSMCYGAANRFKGYLSYRLGVVIMANYNSVSGCFKLPFKLLAEKRRWTREQKGKPKLPPLYTYADYYEVEKLKKHLTYHLGNEIMHCFMTPLGLLTWPFAVRKAFKKYVKGRE
ncbi:hypothetical protein [Francisella uliginis]|uniref:Uncharacterized protein n=1 Tax=Francisella uliginis TaxID=573570 RepID=A0A1L4BU59_9GAMM|nr:hypothetical protein [Francisella uliginis]API87375.1 hypothetical protein F7310_08365 [Francisella uliginis]